MAIRIAGRSVISVRTKRIVQGAEFDEVRRALRSGNRDTGAASARPVAHAAIMGPSPRAVPAPIRARPRPPAPAPVLVLAPDPPHDPNHDHGVDRTPALLGPKWPQETCGPPPQSTTTIAAAPAQCAPATRDALAFGLIHATAPTAT